MNTDNYDFEKSSFPQDLGSYTSFIDKQSNSFINDQNSGVYSLNQSLISFDLSSLYNSSKWTNTNDMFITIPIVMVCATSVAGAAPTLAPPEAGWALQCLKSGYHNLIHQADLQVDGKTIHETQPFLGTFTGIRLLSELSQNDLKSFGSTIGFSDVLDTASSTIYNAAVPTANGNGLTNNNAFGSTTQTTLTGSTGHQNFGLCNEAINKRVLKVVDTTKNGISNIRSIVSGDQLRTEFKSTYEVSGTNYGVITDLAIIRLKDIFDAMGSIGIVKRFNGVLRLYINTGALYATCATGVTPNYAYSVANSTFNNTCPFTINNLNTDATVGIKALQTQISAGLFIGKALNTNLNGVNLGLSNAQHKMLSCRLYYSSIVMEPEKALAYSRASAKNVVYKDYYFNQISAVGSGTTYSQLVQSGITNPYALILVPYIASTVTGQGNGGQFQSPFDTCPATGAPIVLENLQVTLGGQQVLNSPYYYGFEDYVTQFSNAEALTSGDFGVSCGVVSKEWWEMNRVYYINLSRGTKADQITPRNIVVSFKNASSVVIDVQVFTVYLNNFVIDVNTGAITR